MSLPYGTVDFQTISFPTKQKIESSSETNSALKPKFWNLHSTLHQMLDQQRLKIKDWILKAKYLRKTEDRWLDNED